MALPGLIDWLSRIQAARLVGVLSMVPGAEGAARPEVGQVRADGAVCAGAGDGVATGARLVLEVGQPGGGRRIAGRVGRWWWVTMVGQPRLVVGRGHGIDEEDHVGVLDAAELGALAPIDARRARR